MKQNFAKEREYMVWSQIETMSVRDDNILEIFRETPREPFLPEVKQVVAYKDEDINIGQGRSLMEPSVHARLLQELEIKSSDVALNIGSSTGYSSAVLSKLASTVVQIESLSDMRIFSEQQFLDMQIANVVSLDGVLTEGCQEYAPYDIIFINGAVASRPDRILEQLAVNGKCACVVQPDPRVQGKAILYQRINNEVISDKVLFDASIPYLQGFEPIEEFSL